MPTLRNETKINVNGIECDDTEKVKGVLNKITEDLREKS